MELHTTDDGRPQQLAFFGLALDSAWTVPQGASAQDRARALAVKLAEQRFALSDEQCALWPFVCAPDVPAELRTCGVNWRNDALQRALGEAIEQLAERYFDLPPVERRARWTELNAAAQHAPELLPRLKHLETALDVDATDLRDPDARVQTLFDELRTTYALPPDERATRRVALARDKLCEMGDWAGAATTALRRVRELPDLGHTYLTALERQPSRLRRIEKRLRTLWLYVFTLRHPKTRKFLGVLALIGIALTAFIGSERAKSPERQRRDAARLQAEHQRAQTLEQLNQAGERERARLSKIAVLMVVPESQVPQLQEQGKIPVNSPSSWWYTRIAADFYFANRSVDGCRLPTVTEFFETPDGLVIVLSDPDYALFQQCVAREAR